MLYFKQVLTFFRIIDNNDGQISLTNIALMVVLYKLFKSTDTSMTDIGGLFIGLSSYSYKKYVNADLVKSLSKNQVVQKAEEIISSQ